MKKIQNSYGAMEYTICKKKLSKQNLFHTVLVEKFRYISQLVNIDGEGER